MKKEKDNYKLILYGFLVFALIISLVSIFSVSKILFPKTQAEVTSVNSMPGVSSMSLTAFDKKLAMGFMDKDNDGKCDVCGMDVEVCMQSGQIQCNMDPKSAIGVLGSQHIHADWKIYINGKSPDFSDKAHMDRMRAGLPVSSFIHVDSGAPLPEKTGDTLHMHATGVPLWIFFESIGWKFNKDCLILDTGEKYCTDNKNGLKLYVNGKVNSEWENYVFKNSDKILISYGNESDLTQQLISITDFAKNH